MRDELATLSDSFVLGQVRYYRGILHCRPERNASLADGCLRMYESEAAKRKLTTRQPETNQEQTK